MQNKYLQNINEYFRDCDSIHDLIRIRSVEYTRDLLKTFEIFTLEKDQEIQSDHDHLTLLAQLIEKLASTNLNNAVFFAGYNATLSFLKGRIPADKKEIFEHIQSGKLLANFSVSEVCGGSDIRKISSFIEEKDGFYVLNGNKYYSTMVASAAYMIVVAKLNKNNKTYFCPVLVSTCSEGVHIEEKIETLGLKTITEYHVIFNNVKIEASCLLTSPSQNLEEIQAIIQRARFFIGIMAIGAMKRSVELMIRYAERRYVAPGKLIGMLESREKINGSIYKIIALEKLKTLILNEVSKTGKLPSEAVLLFKNLGAEFGYQVVDDALQLLGGRGYEEENMLSTFLRDIRAFRIFEGPTETLSYLLGVLIVNDSTPFFDSIGINRTILNKKLHEIRTRLPIFKNAEKVTIEHDFFSISGILASWWILCEILKDSSNLLEKKAFAYFQNHYDLLFAKYFNHLENILETREHLDYEAITEAFIANTISFPSLGRNKTRLQKELE